MCYGIAARTGELGPIAERARAAADCLLPQKGHLGGRTREGIATPQSRGLVTLTQRRLADGRFAFLATRLRR